MSEDLGKAPEEIEPEARRPGSAPAKKPLAEFLADFEARLRDHPDEPATGALQVVEDRAAGFRRSPASAPNPPVTAPAVVPKPPPELEVEPIEEVPVEAVRQTSAATRAEPAGETDAATTVADGAEATAEPASADGATVDAPGESRRVRGRRRRKHRHRAH